MKKILLFILVSVFITNSSCKKDWLDAKPDKRLVVPKTLADLQAMLDNTIEVFNFNQPELGEIGSDDYYVLYPAWLALSTNFERNGYIWAKDVYNGEANFDWTTPYERIFYNNYVLETVVNIPKDSTNFLNWNNVKGSALFGRGFNFYTLADLFARPFDSITADTDPGIPLRLHSDINDKTTRATLSQTYKQIIDDLKESVFFLPAIPAYKTRPSKSSAYAMLARTYLNMGNYSLALQYADSCISLQPVLINYNTFDITSQFPFSIFPTFIDEVIYFAAMNYYGVIGNSVAIVDSSIYRSYAENDLRKYLFIDTTDGHPRFKGGYDGYTGFGGIATDEIYLVSAECNARAGNTGQAMDRLNKLLENRWKTGTFTPLSASTSEQALRLIINERRKELIFRGLRWTDLRRLNKDPRFAVTLSRNLNGNLYTLPPNDPRYVYPIPDQEIRISGIAQNPR